MKGITNIISFVLLMALHQVGWSATGNLFTITGSGTVATLDITVCLNGKGPLSCQDYTVTREILSVRTVAPNHTYPAVGIKIRTPGYTPSGCTLSRNGYCLFSVSDTTPATITATSTAMGLGLTSINPVSGVVAGETSFTLTGTNLAGATVVTFDGVAATGVYPKNSTTVTGVTPAHQPGIVTVVITTPQGSAKLINGYTYVANQIGLPSGGGLIACLSGTNNLIAATADISTGITWGGTTQGNQTDVNGAISNSNGALNTTSIVASLTGVGIPIDSYAAGLCANYAVDSQGITPCQPANVCYDNWFLPAGNNNTPSGQLNCLFANKIPLNNAGADLQDAFYWSSTQSTSVTAWGQNFATSTQSPLNKDNPFVRVRCVRSFIG